MIAGVDEAGRGPLAGPVVAAAVILPAQHNIAVRDSKKLTAKAREKLYAEICAQSVAWCIAEASVAEIDHYNILQATLLAMRRAVLGLKITPTQVLIDGNAKPAFAADIKFVVETIVRGDDLVPAISAASILAKVYRDGLLEQLHLKYPEYGFMQHKGYPTAAHLAALRQYGATPEHRRSFAPVAKCLVTA